MPVRFWAEVLRDKHKRGHWVAYVTPKGGELCELDILVEDEAIKVFDGERSHVALVLGARPDGFDFHASSNVHDSMLNSITEEEMRENDVGWLTGSEGLGDPESGRWWVAKLSWKALLLQERGDHLFVLDADNNFMRIFVTDSGLLVICFGRISRTHGP
jgi:hypothetical protein